MNEDDIIALAPAWTVQTADISGRVAAAIGAEANSAGPDSMFALLAELGEEMRALRREVGEQRRTVALLRDEIARLRTELHPRSVTRIAPFIATEALTRPW